MHLPDVQRSPNTGWRDAVIVFHWKRLGLYFSLCGWYSLFFSSETVKIFRKFSCGLSQQPELCWRDLFFSSALYTLHSTTVYFLLCWSVGAWLYSYLYGNGAQYIVLIIQPKGEKALWLELFHCQNRFYIFFMCCWGNNNTIHLTSK